jgi:bifunctional ADP-heptose synthase (sugar kinase/adenylyltransferase)
MEAGAALDGQIVVAGFMCLDMFPTFYNNSSIVPGKLVQVGPCSFSPGGAVPNVGLALARLGVPVQLWGKVGSDPYGAVLRELLKTPDERDHSSHVSLSLSLVSSLRSVCSRSSCQNDDRPRIRWCCSHRMLIVLSFCTQVRMTRGRRATST